MSKPLVIPLRRPSGEQGGFLRLWSRRDVVDDEPGVALAVHEASEYQFVVELAGERPAEIEPGELFSLDPDASNEIGASIGRGRLRTGNYVGAVDIVVTASNGSQLTGLLEVRSTKLDFENQYRWMLAGVASEAAELLLRSFSPAQVGLRPDVAGRGETIYQQVAFLSAILERPHTIEAFERVLRAPHVSYVDTHQYMPLSRGLNGSSAAMRALTRSGKRVGAPRGLNVASLPEVASGTTAEASIDNPSNQFVRFVLEHWAQLLDRAQRMLRDDSPAGRRGLREVAKLSSLVEGWRSDRRLSDVGPLRHLPAGDQVIMRRPGYREIHQAFLESLAAAMLRWDGVDAVIHAGQRNVALLYEYWTYLELRRLVVEFCDYSDSSTLVELTDAGMHLTLLRGRQRVVTGYVVKAGRLIDVELWFNRNFEAPEDSWSLQMRPDCSLRFKAAFGANKVDTWVHFDAKYRAEAVSDLFVGDDESRTSHRADLLKMHAYRDAIRWSAGAYVLFPGTDDRYERQHHEVLPGLGAFALAPGSDGHATTASTARLRQFLDQVLDHVAQQASNRERADYWHRVAHSDPPLGEACDFVPLDRPPADTPVLLGFYWGARHRTWIEESLLYNLRLGDRAGAVTRVGPEASAPYLVLWSDVDELVTTWRLRPEFKVFSAEELRELGYPREPSGRYLCRLLESRVEHELELSGAALAALARNGERGRPVVRTWADVLRSAQGGVAPLGAQLLVE
jgi:predicted component of viral defense system (DUF524 family)